MIELKIGKEYKPDELKQMFGNTIPKYGHIICMTGNKPSDNKVHIFEEHPGGSVPLSPGWTPHELSLHPNVQLSDLLGNWHSMVIKTGKTDDHYGRTGLNNIDIAKNEVILQFYGQGGASTSVISRALSPECTGMKLIKGSYGGDGVINAELSFKKWVRCVIGMDDTDTKYEGATWVSGLKISNDLMKEFPKDVFYLGQTNTQLWSKCPYKTKNCVTTGLLLAINPIKLPIVLDEYQKLLVKETLSDDAAFSIAIGIDLDFEKLKNYTLKAKTEFVSIPEALHVAQDLGIELNPALPKMTEAKGLVGALGALYYTIKPDYLNAIMEFR